MKNKLISIFSITLGLGLSGFSLAQAQKHPANPAHSPQMKPNQPHSTAGATAPVKAGTPPAKAPTKPTALDFSTKDADGKNFELKTALAAGDGVVINFWASWCTSCAEEIPELEAFQKKYPKYRFYGLNVGEELSKAQKFVKRNSYPYKVILDPTEAISKKFDIDGLPVTIVISKSGEIIYRGNRPPKSL